MALDESKPEDEIFENQGITFLIEKALFEEVKPVEVDFVTTPRGSGFKLTSSLSQGSSCSSSCSC